MLSQLRHQADSNPDWACRFSLFLHVEEPALCMNDDEQRVSTSLGAGSCQGQNRGGAAASSSPAAGCENQETRGTGVGACLGLGKVLAVAKGGKPEPN